MQDSVRVHVHSVVGIAYGSAVVDNIVDVAGDVAGHVFAARFSMTCRGRTRTSWRPAPRRDR